MARRWGVAPVAFSAMLVLGACGGGETDSGSPSGSGSDGLTTAAAPEPDGRIVFNRGEGGTENIFTYTINPDGSDEQQLFSTGRSENPRWSPDGTEIQIFCCDDGMVAHLSIPSTGELRIVRAARPGRRDLLRRRLVPRRRTARLRGLRRGRPEPERIYSVRSSDGGDLTRITTNPEGDDIPGDFSPEGDRLVFVRSTRAAGPGSS